MLKAIAKKTLRKEHWDFLVWYRSRFGLLPAIRACIELFCNKGVGRAPNRLTGGSVFLRPGTADQNVYDQIFISKEYDTDLCDPLFIVDAGAHIGLASVFFASKYPKATIIAIEPEPSNFAMLLVNAKDHTNVRTVQAGLWSRKTHLHIQDSNVATWSFRVAEDASGEGIPAIGVRDIISDFNAPRIDVLKIDIEGSELEVLSHSTSWIDDVQTLVIELHDRFRPGCSEALEKALSGHDYRKSISGKTIVITNLSRVST